MSDTFTIEDLTPGDILLYRAEDGAKNWISAMIRKLDGTEVSHAALYMGDGTVAEALAMGAHRGLDTQPVAASIDGCRWVAVRRMLPPPGPMAPVIEVAEEYLADDNRYAYEQIFLLAGICLTRKLDTANPFLLRIVRGVFDLSTAALNRLRSEDKEPMICSEFVFRTYDEVFPVDDDPYTLEILSQTAEPARRFSLFHRRMDATAPQPPTVHPESLLASLPLQFEPLPDSGVSGSAPLTETELDTLVEEYLAEDERKAAPRACSAADLPDVSSSDLLGSAQAFATTLAHSAVEKTEAATARHGLVESRGDARARTLTEIIADFVTPGDLFQSPSLKEVGKLRP